jgi:hypothetical protein
MKMLIKKSSLTLLTVLISYLCIELLSLVVYYSYKGELLSFSKSHQLLEETATYTHKIRYENPMHIKKGVLHPYLGVAGAPGLADMGMGKAIKPRDPKTLKVVMLGGSVAFHQGNSKNATQILQKKLTAIPAFKNKTLEMRVLAFPSYKQPQQVISLILSILFMEKPDIVINLDGHNDIVFSYDGYESGFFYGYPALWDNVTAGIHTHPDQITTMADIIQFKEYQKSWATVIDNIPIKYSTTALLVWELGDKILENKINEARTIYNNYRKQSGKDNVVTGPFKKYPVGKEIKLISNLWVSSSQMLKKLSNAYGAEYFHFLQPLPTWPEGKPLSAEEKKLGINNGTNINGRRVRWYQLLLKESEKLKQDNINIYSLVDVFKNESRTVYIDVCCHVNFRGKNIMSEAMGDAIVQYYRNKSD